MANVINGTQYSTLAVSYANLVNVLAGASTYLYSALNLIAQLNDVYPTVDLIIPFNNVYVQQSATLTSTSGLLSAVRALNAHVLLRARTNLGVPYTDINTWFADQSLAGHPVSFPQSWADMSLAVGQNVETFVD